MNEFKVGDTVKCIDFPEGEGAEGVIEVGKEYIIKDVSRTDDIGQLLNFEDLPKYPSFVFTERHFVLVPQIQDNEFVKVMREHERMLEL